MHYCKGTETVSLYKTLKGVCKKNIQRSFETKVKAKNATTDPDEVRQGDVFFAVCGDDLDEAVGVAIHRGCCAVVAERPANGADSVPFYIVPNAAECYAAFCQAVYDYPAKSLKMIAVTGTSGKTTTSYLIAGVLAESGCQVGHIGSLGIFDGIDYHAVSEDSLSPEELAIWLHRMMMNGCTHAVVEVSSRCIVEGTLGGIAFDAVCLTNIRKDHLDYHKTVEQYRRSKLSIFKYAKKNALAVCNIDDRITEAIIPLINQPLLAVGIRNQAEVGSMLVERFAGEQTFLVTVGTEVIPLRTKMIGDEHIYDCLLATAVGVGMDIDIKTVASGIERIETVPGRMERIECGQNFNVFIDSARTADSLSATLRTLQEITSGRLICVFGTAGHHDASNHSAFAKTLQGGADTVVLTSSNDSLGSDSVLSLCGIGKDFAEETGAAVIPNRADAIAWGLSEARSGDTVLIITQGLMDLAIDNLDTVPFSDRFFTKQWLEEKRPQNLA